MTAPGTRGSDPWLIRLRLLLGSAVLAWEVGFDPRARWWAIVVAIWLLGAPLEEIVKLFTAGRIAISVRRAEDDKDSEDEDT